MLIDFCHHSVKPKIKCNKVAFDGYEIDNLVSACTSLKSKGFISENFVKPPVNITVQFPCNICIYRVVIDPVIGQQQSCDVKLFTASYKGIDPWLYEDTPGLNDRELKTDGLLFNFIASSTQDMPALTCYQNDFFRDRGYWNRDTIEHQSSFPVFVQLKGKKPSALFNVSHLSVNVMRARGGKSVAIKRLEVWGMPSRNVTDKAQQMLQLTYQTSIRAITESLVKTTKNKEENTVPIETTDTNHSDFIPYGEVEVPEDFVDQITFEIMAVPMLLPCGKNIDKCTLERFINIEASWGRRPSDPFTGVVFTSTSQAFPNTALKSRIDQFVTQHSNVLNVPRTLGKGQLGDDGRRRCSKIVSSSLVEQPYSSQTMKRHPSPKLSEEVLENKVSNSTTRINKILSNQRKRKFSPDRNLNVETCTRNSFSKSINLVPSKYSKSDFDYHRISVPKELRICGNENLTQPLYPSETSTEKCLVTDTRHSSYQKQLSLKPSGQNHSQSLSSSLDSALLSTLTSLPTFTKCLKQKEDVQSEAEILDKSCCVCLNDKATVLYKLPCQHIMCRQCLQKCNGQINCKTCSTQCASKDIVRVFT